MNWIGALVSFAVLLQTLEMFWIPRFPAETLAQEYPWALRPLLKWDHLILSFRFTAAGLALISASPVEVSVLLMTSWMVAMRWRGTLNGGSDIMTFHILAAWFISLAFPHLEKACLYYIGIQLILSYEVAGLAKVVNPAWRNGSALAVFLRRWGYTFPPQLCLLISWTIVLFEILFPLAVFAPLPFIAAGALFHLANAYVFGLNRFFFVWLAAYPALIFLAQTIS